ncbi:MAG: N-6 DNA methylase [Bacteroidales bacterium]|nr:N-6 DNA methylase [Bacteroidales bacterium]
MSLFQNSVLNKYLRALDTEKVEVAYNKFTNHFHNLQVQENIRNSKEEQYQGGFLIDLFVNILGYTKNPAPAFNLTTELKNVKDAKKTDGAILDGKQVLAVIELKGTNTTDLSKVEAQAFGYKNNQPGCNYVITSNFEKIRFYIDNAVDFEEFNLFQMTKERFDVFWLCLSADYLLKDLPKKIKSESLTQEENITEQLYKDYSAFRNDVFNSIQTANPQYDKLTLFKKTQKLLDRFLFIFFAEDRLLLPPNSIRSIVNQWKDLRDKYDEYFPLYDRFLKFFGYMNTGHKGHHHDIFAYNGGLFAPDEILDNIKIDDDILHKHTVNLSNYNYESEVDVNILGHIFEHSLNEIESIQSEIKGEAIDKSKTRRKKDGVFYTPKYITKYIVKNTVGKLCDEKKLALNIQEEEYEKERKGRRKDTLKQLLQQLEDYREWLLQITICDPACGSGAFLNQALEYLIAEHRYIDELQAKLLGDSMILSEVENSILENNLYGVDINEESVEIAKLSLWLRTAQKGRALTSLNDNIKCGNSLIDDPEVAGDKAFNWQEEFPDIFAKGGFDVVIGNPPYVQSHSISELEKSYIYKNYKTAEYQINTYGVFVDQFINILKINSLYSLIIPNYWLSTKFDKLLRKEVFIDNHALEVINTYEVFKSATVDTLILTGRKTKTAKHTTIFYSISKSFKTIEDRLNAINLKIWEYTEQKHFTKGDEEKTIGFSNECKLSGEKTLKDYFSIYQGMKPYEIGKGNPAQSREMLKAKIYHSSTRID